MNHLGLFRKLSVTIKHVIDHLGIDSDSELLYHKHIFFKKKISNMESPDTIFVLVTDNNYYLRAKQTIIDIRIKGRWLGEIALITIDFELSNNFKDYYEVIEVKIPPLDKNKLISLLPEGGFHGSDKREINRINQWEKLQVFDDYFKKWDRVVFMDAGMRLFDSVKYLLELEYKDSILQHREEHSKFYDALYKNNNDLLKGVTEDFGKSIESESVFLNGLWIYDTKILDICNKQELVDGMYKYPLCLRNEMTLMQLFFDFKYNLVKPLPIKASNDKILFGWSDVDYSGTTWRNFCLIKYPTSI